MGLLSSLLVGQDHPATKAAPPTTSAGAIAFQDVTEEMGITNFQKLPGSFPPCPADEDHRYFHWPFNLCVGDFNGDGTPDLFCGQHGEPAQGHSHLFLLDPKTRRFAIHRGDKLVSAPPRGIRGAYISAVVDANDDGRLDIALSDGDMSGAVLINRPQEGRPAFEKKAFGSPSGMAFSDLDNSGGLATVVSRADLLPIYRGVGTDKKDLIDTGIAVFGNRHSNVVLADFNNDGFDDILYAEVSIKGASTKPSDRKDRLRLFVNRGGMKFQEISAYAGLARSCTGQIAVGDINNDGNLDLIVMGTANSEIPDGSFKIYLNDGEARFTDVSAKSPVKLPAKWRWEMDIRYNMLLADLDNDGLQDLVVSPTYGYYRNKGDGSFEDFTLVRANPTGNGIVCAADFHGDGRLDLAILCQESEPVRVLRNNTRNSGRYLEVRLSQKDKNLFALGAKIYAYKPGMLGDANGQIAMRELMTNPMNLVEYAPVHLGLGAQEKVDLLIVFPTGKIVEKKGLATNQTLKIEDTEASRTVKFQVKTIKSAAAG